MKSRCREDKSFTSNCPSQILNQCGIIEGHKSGLSFSIQSGGIPGRSRLPSNIHFLVWTLIYRHVAEHQELHKKARLQNPHLLDGLCCLATSMFGLSLARSLLSQASPPFTHREGPGRRFPRTPRVELKGRWSLFTGKSTFVGVKMRQWRRLSQLMWWELKRSLDSSSDVENLQHQRTCRISGRYETFIKKPPPGHV